MEYLLVNNIQTETPRWRCHHLSSPCLPTDSGRPLLSRNWTDACPLCTYDAFSLSIWLGVRTLVEYRLQATTQLAEICPVTVVRWPFPKCVIWSRCLATRRFCLLCFGQSRFLVYISSFAANNNLPRSCTREWTERKSLVYDKEWTGINIRMIHAIKTLYNKEWTGKPYNDYAMKTLCNKEWTGKH